MNRQQGGREGRGGDGDRAEALADDLRRVVGTLVRAVRAMPGGEKTAQSDTLGLLEREGAMNVAAMAERRGVRHQTMRLVVAQMEAAGWVEGMPDPADGRSRLYALSAAGQAEVERARAIRIARIGGRIREALSEAEQAQLHAAIPLLERIAAGSAGS
ncbi:MarR family winged helix-turn-helix transcriptional regulator [Novosphingobium sp. 9]|uniref:MarR family winged helix-turn-helix transcriptional regulator n=1 Tax=Novosphingobium sp. 9 TaxID=2025349 RepID=UPI0021B5E83A|nr:MarR family transcriptional regulator [Novosphingobium sp. 9]